MKRGLNELSFVIDFVDFSFVNDKVFKDLSFKNGMLSFRFLLLLLCHLICYCCGFVISFVIVADLSSRVVIVARDLKVL